MSGGLLRWHEARHGDRAALQNFQCTEDPIKRASTGYKREHPRPWEWRLQGKIRQLKPPFDGPEYLLLGEDDEGLAAVSMFRETNGPSQVLLMCLAVALRLRFRGGGFADELAVRTMDEITEHAVAQDVAAVDLNALVDEGNRHSQSLCRRMGLAHTSMWDDQLQVWSAMVLMPGNDDGSDSGVL